MKIQQRFTKTYLIKFVFCKSEKKKETSGS